MNLKDTPCPLQIGGIVPWCHHGPHSPNACDGAGMDSPELMGRNCCLIHHLVLVVAEATDPKTCPPGISSVCLTFGGKTLCDINHAISLCVAEHDVSLANHIIAFLRIHKGASHNPVSRADFVGSSFSDKSKFFLFLKSSKS